MVKGAKNKGFSLTEVLIAAGILMMGFALVANMFPLGVKLTTLATEETIGVIAAKEAVAKVKLYGVDLPALLAAGGMVDFEDVSAIPEEEFYYPSTTAPKEEKRYCWSALVRADGIGVEVFVFVSRKAGSGARFPWWDGSSGVWRTDGSLPKPVPILITAAGALGDADTDEIEVVDPTLAYLVSEGATLVDSATGNKMRVMVREKAVAGDTSYRKLVLRDENFERTTAFPRYIWVVPPSSSGGRYPCILVHSESFI